MPTIARLALLFLFLCLSRTQCSLTPPTCPVRTFCIAASVDQSSTSSNVSLVLSELSTRFCGCQTIDGSVDLAFPGVMADVPFTENTFNFLYHLREITGYLRVSNLPQTSRLSLPNLILIRGRELTVLGNGLEISGSQVDNVSLPQLREISSGNVSIHNSSWCGYLSVNWEDILEAGQLSVSENSTSCTQPVCIGCEEDHCWEPGVCQELNKVGRNSPAADCRGERYFLSVTDNRTFCCDESCAGGCNGTGDTDCLFCEGFSSDGKCVIECPPEFILSNNVQVRNPDYRVQAGFLCLTECPAGFFDELGKCVVQCRDGFMAEGSRCVRCISLCPNGTECSGWQGLDPVRNNTDPILTNFLNQECTIVNGNIRITEETAAALRSNQVTLQSLRRFEHVRVIRGILDLTGWDDSLPSLNFFRNVQYIGTDNTSVLSPSSFALRLFNHTGIDLVDLSNLRQIRYGNVEIGANDELCYVGDFQTSLTSTYFALPSAQNLTLGSSPFRSVQDCINKTCHSECVPERRCWGPNDTNCVLCLNFRYEQEWKCVPDCSLDSDTYEDSSLTLRSYKYCASCDVECIGCTGAGPFLCKACRNFEIRFRNGSRKCVPSCELGYYQDGQICRECDRLCVGGCSGPGSYVGSGGCASCRIVNFNSNEEQIGCADGACPVNTYIELLGEAIGAVPVQNQACFPCHPNCLSCSGPNSTDCIACSAGSRSEGSVMVNGMERLTCVTSRDTSSDTTPSIVGGIFGALGLFILLMILLVVLFCLYRHWCRADPHKHVEEELIGIDNEVYGSLPDINEKDYPVPKLRTQSLLTSVDSLQFVEKIGQGTFGTVHKGLWQPPGEEFQYTVAIKVLNDDTPPSATQELLNEGVAMASMDHPYIVRLYAMSKGENLMLVTQFLPMGSLLYFLKKYKSELNAYHLLTYGQQIAEGMAYLEDQRMVHRDLAARNVLVQTSSKVKIADFGLSKCLEVGESGYKAGKGKVPVRWLAPECLRRCEFSHKSDVWAFGVTLWEVLTFGAKPYGKKNAQEVGMAIEKGERLPQPTTTSIELYATLLKCWLNSPQSRPQFTSLGSTLHQMSADPLRYVSTTKDGALSSYSDLPVDEHTDDESQYESFDALLIPQESAINGTVISNSHSVPDVGDDYHVLTDATQGYEHPVADGETLTNGDLDYHTIDDDNHSPPPDYHEIDEEDSDNDGYMLSDAIKGYEDPVVSKLSPVNGYEDPIIGNSDGVNGYEDPIIENSDAIKGYEDPVISSSNLQDEDEGYQVLEDDEGPPEYHDITENKKNEGLPQPD